MSSAVKIDGSGVGQEISSSSVRNSDFEQLFQAHQRSVYGWILRMVRNPAAAEDLTIETFWRVYQNMARYDPSRPFAPWVRRLASRVALVWLRSQRPERSIPDHFLDGARAPAVADPVGQAEIRLKVAQAFERLTPKLRVAAALAVIEELPQKDIAEALGISLSTVKVRIFRAMRLLRRDLKRQGITP